VDIYVIFPVSYYYRINSEKKSIFNLGYEADAEGFSPTPPSSSSDSSTASHRPRDSSRGKKTAGRQSSTPTKSVSTDEHPPGPPKHRSDPPKHEPNVSKHPPALNNDGDDDSDADVCPPPSINGSYTITVCPPFPFILGPNMVVHPPGPPTYGLNPAAYPPGPPKHRSNPPTHQPNVAKHLPAVNNDSDDDSDANVCPPPSIDGNYAITMRPPGPPTHGLNPGVPPPGPRNRGLNPGPGVPPPGYSINKQRVPIYTPMYVPPPFDPNSNAAIYPPAFDNDDDDSDDADVCPPPSINCNCTITICAQCCVPGKRTVVLPPTSFY
jgi:hypothetical protein